MSSFCTNTADSKMHTHIPNLPNLSILSILSILPILPILLIIPIHPSSNKKMGTEVPIYQNAILFCPYNVGLAVKTVQPS